MNEITNYNLLRKGFEAYEIKNMIITQRDLKRNYGIDMKMKNLIEVYQNNDFNNLESLAYNILN